MGQGAKRLEDDPFTCRNPNNRNRCPDCFRRDHGSHQVKSFLCVGPLLALNSAGRCCPLTSGANFCQSSNHGSSNDQTHDPCVGRFKRRSYNARNGRHWQRTTRGRSCGKAVSHRSAAYLLDSRRFGDCTYFPDYRPMVGHKGLGIPRESLIHRQESAPLSISLSWTRPDWLYPIFHPSPRGTCGCSSIGGVSNVALHLERGI